MVKILFPMSFGLPQFQHEDLAKCGEELKSLSTNFSEELAKLPKLAAP